MDWVFWVIGAIFVFMFVIVPTLIVSAMRFNMTRPFVPFDEWNAPFAQIAAEQEHGDWLVQQGYRLIGRVAAIEQIPSVTICVTAYEHVAFGRTAAILLAFAAADEKLLPLSEAGLAINQEARPNSTVLDISTAFADGLVVNTQRTTEPEMFPDTDTIRKRRWLGIDFADLHRLHRAFETDAFSERPKERAQRCLASEPLPLDSHRGGLLEMTGYTTSGALKQTHTGVYRVPFFKGIVAVWWQLPPLKYLVPWRRRRATQAALEKLVADASDRRVEVHRKVVRPLAPETERLLEELYSVEEAELVEEDNPPTDDAVAAMRNFLDEQS
ncbi:MAG: hypothetical protein AAGI46_15170 [Planctomycetota bacterium]